jgi:hypothetical protein
MRDLRPPKVPLRAIPRLLSLRDKQESASAGSTSSPLRVGPLGRIVIGAGGTALFITCLYSAYGPASVGDMKATIVMLLSGWVFAVGAFTVSELLSSLSNRHRFLASFGFAIVCAAVTSVWGVTIFHSPTPTIQKAGARMFFQIGGFSKTNKTMAVIMVNSGDVIARIGTRLGSNLVFMDHVLSEREENACYEAALKSLPPIGNGMEIPINVGHTTDAPINLSDAQFDAIMNGTAYFYIFAVANFRDELTPSGKINLASVCSYFNKNTTTGLACLSHIESRLQN